MKILISDASALIDLEQTGLIDAVLRLPYEVYTSDALFKRELEGEKGINLCQAGLKIATLDDSDARHALDIHRSSPHLAIVDAFALALAQRSKQILLAGDPVLQAAANAHRLEWRCMMWILDQLEELNICHASELSAALSILQTAPRRRYSANEIEVRADRYGAMAHKR